MKLISKLLLLGGLAALTVAPMAARADYSKCTKSIRAQGYFITDIDTDWGRPLDRFDVVKNGREFDLYVDKSTCKVVQSVADDRYNHYND